MSVLVSGASSGLGRFLCERLNADRFDRIHCRAPKESYDTIIHCAFNMAGDVPSGHIAEYVNDTISLTEWLLSIPHERFIFLSSIAVYPPQADGLSEDVSFPAQDAQGFYGVTKLICEGIVQLRAINPLILRCAPLLGPHIRKNLLMRMVLGEEESLPIAADSSVNYVSYEQVETVIGQAAERGLDGIFNVASAANATFGEIAADLGRSISFGDQLIKTTCVNNTKAAALCPSLKDGTRENVQRFINKYPLKNV